ncbi:hypothetical protein CA11_36600 [Gimesia maris]|uniref:DUF4062 domain-containing protein n=1 Tax=Gimesia maris TaxID=122 RepID=UPI0011885328|nr:DUF4062 domain-containing protein [Gimesia maris]QDU15832.1 hypothetical protein CA11_36600 [Gimesia maris]
MRVFVSSTVYDLIDVRAELEQLLRELGISPVMSDEKLSEFNFVFDANSIETCLLNIESCDAVIVVLDQRYGPLLGNYGFDDVSATHLEYRHAKKHAKPIYFYVRDRLEADHNVTQKNKAIEGVKFSWVSTKDKGLFTFLKEHRALRADSHENNWFSIFTNVVDLKASIRQHFEPVVKPQVLLRAIQENRFPLFTSHFIADVETFAGIQSITCRMVLKNVGLVPAFDLKTQWQFDNIEVETTEIVAPNQDCTSTLIANIAYGDVNVVFTAEYTSTIGVTVRERYKIKCFIHQGTLISGATLEQRTYHNTPPPTVVIQDP